jgi:hypothetical protein
MRTVVLGAVLVVGLVVTAAAVTADPGSDLSRPTALDRSALQERGLIALSTPVGDKYQQVTVIDPKTEAMSVYHIDLSDGKIRLRSVRNFHWDLQMAHFNGTAPLPREIQILLEQQ